MTYSLESLQQPIPQTPICCKQCFTQNDHINTQQRQPTVNFDKHFYKYILFIGVNLFKNCFFTLQLLGRV